MMNINIPMCGEVNGVFRHVFADPNESERCRCGAFFLQNADEIPKNSSGVVSSAKEEAEQAKSKAQQT